MTMKISDEIRKWADDLDSDDAVCTTATLYDIADLIDDEMVELPKDKDGEPIHVGDTVFGCASGMKLVVYALRMADRWTISTDCGFIDKASSVTHVKPESWESIADELDQMVDSADSADDSCEKLASIAYRIRKLVEKEDKR